MNKPMREGFVAEEPVDSSKVIEAKTEPEQVQEDVDTWPLVITLMHKPVERERGQLLKELSFREPTAGDLMRCGGNPCRVEIVEVNGGNVTWMPIIDDSKMLRLMASLCGVLEPQLQRMDPRDYNSCAHRLRRFFLPEQGIW